MDGAQWFLHAVEHDLRIRVGLLQSGAQRDRPTGATEFNILAVGSAEAITDQGAARVALEGLVDVTDLDVHLHTPRSVRTKMRLELGDDVVGVQAGGDAQVQLRLGSVRHSINSMSHRGGAKTSDADGRPSPQLRGNLGVVTEDVDTVEDACIAAEGLGVITHALPLAGAVHSVDGDRP